MALIGIEEHKYSKRKYLEISVQAALSYANETLIYTLMPIYKLRNGNRTQGTCRTLTGTVSLFIKDSLDFTRLLHFVLESLSRGWDVWKAHLRWLALTSFSSYGAGYTPEGWRPHMLQILNPYSPSLASFTHFLGSHPKTRSEQKVVQSKFLTSLRCNPDAALLKLYTVLLPKTQRSQCSLRLLFSLWTSCSVWVDHAYVRPPPQTIFVDSNLERNPLCSVRAKAFVTCFLDLGSNTAGVLNDQQCSLCTFRITYWGWGREQGVSLFKLGKTWFGLNLKVILLKSWCGTQNTQIKQTC